jgi:hypothetical protein
MTLHCVIYGKAVILLDAVRANCCPHSVCLTVVSYLQLDDTALQLYRDGDYGSYLDLEASISEQQEEFDGFQTK